jgi:hypothetical protein
MLFASKYAFLGRSCLHSRQLAIFGMRYQILEFLFNEGVLLIRRNIIDVNLYLRSVLSIKTDLCRHWTKIPFRAMHKIIFLTNLL